MNERNLSYPERTHAMYLLIQDTLHDGIVLLVTSNVDMHEHNNKNIVNIIIGGIKPRISDTQS